jgi:DamX protein
MDRRVRVLVLSALVFVCAACGGGAPRSSAADILALSQPTPDPTLDAVVRDLPRALAGIPPTATPTPVAVAKPVVRAPAPKPALATQAPPAQPPSKPVPPKPSPTPSPRRGN